MRYKVMCYFDVWREPDGGWTVNESCECGYVKIADQDTAKDICTKLMGMSHLSTNDMRRLHVEEVGETIEVYQKKEMIPLFGLIPEYR